MWSKTNLERRVETVKKKNKNKKMPKNEVIKILYQENIENERGMKAMVLFNVFLIFIILVLVADRFMGLS